MQCNTYVPNGFEFATLGDSIYQTDFTPHVDCTCVSPGVEESDCTAGVYKHRAVYCGSFSVGERTFSFLCMARTVCYVRLFTNGLRNLHKDS
jgi:hypothetical protein